MEFDQVYYDNIVNWIQKQCEGTYQLSDLISDMSTKNKFVFHVKKYIENRGFDQLEVTFNTAYSAIRINEYFASIISSQAAQERQRQQNVANIQNDLKQAATRPLFASEAPTTTTINQNSKRPKGL
jgi:biotin carboxylase